MAEGQRPKRFYEKYGKEYAVLSEGFFLDGTLAADRPNANIRIGGVVEGDLAVSGVIHVLPTGVCRGSVKAPCIIVQGKVDGDLHAGEKIEFGDSAVINGDVTTPHLAVAAGCQFNGAIRSGACRRHDFTEKRLKN